MRGADLSAALVSDHLPYHRMTVVAQAWLVSRPWAVAGVARLLMTVGRFDAMSGGWSVVLERVTRRSATESSPESGRCRDPVGEVHDGSLRHSQMVRRDARGGRSVALGAEHGEQ